MSAESESRSTRRSYAPCDHNTSPVDEVGREGLENVEAELADEAAVIDGHNEVLPDDVDLVALRARGVALPRPVRIPRVSLQYRFERLP